MSLLESDKLSGNLEPFKFGQISDNNTIISCFVSGFILFFETFFSFDKNNIVSHVGEFLLAHCPALIQTQILGYGTKVFVHRRCCFCVIPSFFSVNSCFKTMFFVAKHLNHPMNYIAFLYKTSFNQSLN